MRRELARTVRRIFGRRGSASFGAASLGVVLLAGAALGSGLARTAVDVTDGLTWLPDNPRGEVVQVNPSSGRPETRLQVSGGDAQLEITQQDGLLVVLDRRTGQITSIDLATLLAGGRRQTVPGTSKVLVSEGRIYVVDRAAGTVHNADPVTLVDVGEPWRAGRPLADAVVDENAVLWAADHDGFLHSLEWSETESRFVERAARHVAGAGPRTVLVPHQNGVTLLDLGSGVVVQEGTGRDISAATLQLPGEVLGAQTSPAGLVPASVPDEAVVVIVNGDQVVQADVGAYGCTRPGRPVVFRDKVYVPCRGGNRVVLLDRSGRRGGPDVRTPGTGDPEIVVDDGQLFINAPGGEQGVLVDSNGNTSQIAVRDPDLPVVNPDRPPAPPEVPNPPPPRPPRDDPGRPPGRDNNSPGTPPESRPGQQPSSPPSTTPPPASRPGTLDRAPSAPTGVSVMLLSRTANELTVTVSWGPAMDNGDEITGYSVTANYPGGSRDTQTANTITQLTVPCSSGTLCAGGRLDVSVTATNSAGTGPAGTSSLNIPPRQQQQPGTNPPQQPPPPTTTTNPPPPPTTNNPPPPPTTNEPPPPPSLPTAGAAVIGTATRVDLYTRRLALTPPADWAGHNGPCEVVNTSFSYRYPIACSATTVTVELSEGNNRLVVRAYASDRSRSVDSAPKSFQVREPMCGRVRCLRSETPVQTRFGAGDAGIGLLVAAGLLAVRDRRRSKESRPS